MLVVCIVIVKPAYVGDDVTTWNYNALQAADVGVCCVTYPRPPGIARSFSCV